VYQESYDALVLAPGSAPIRPPLPGIDLPGIFLPCALSQTAARLGSGLLKGR